jgi:hypothetical protein
MLLLYRSMVDHVKGMILMTFLIRPWPPEDFGTLVDSQTFSDVRLEWYTQFENGIDQDGFMLYTNAIFNKDILKSASFNPEVSWGKFLV